MLNYFYTNNRVEIIDFKWFCQMIVERSDLITSSACSSRMGNGANRQIRAKYLITRLTQADRKIPTATSGVENFCAALNLGKKSEYMTQVHRAMAWVRR